MVSETRSATITGASSEIAFAIAARLISDGFEVLATDVSSERRGQYADQLPTVHWFEEDVTRDGAAAEVIDIAVQKFGFVDCIINNAAIISQAPLLKHTREIWDATFDVNVRAPFELLKAAVPFMKRDSVMVNILSLAAYRYTGNHLAYTASKSALVGFTRDAACELAELGIRVVGVAPGPTRSGMMQTMSAEKANILEQVAPLRGVNSVEDIASAVGFVASYSARRITGIVLPVTGGSELAVSGAIGGPDE